MKYSIRTSLFLLPIIAAVHGQEKPIMEITATVDFGEDLGQNFGSLFEARDADGRTVYGAGFAGLYNTAFRMDRFTLQFFVRDGDGKVTFEKLPPPSNDGGTYLFDWDGRLYQFSWYQDRIARWWNDETRTWEVDESFGLGAMSTGQGKMHVAGKVLQFKSGEAWYDDQRILKSPNVGYYHHFYYALGHLVFFHNNRGGDPAFSRAYAVPWKSENGNVDLSKAVTLELTYPGETPFAIGQLGGEIIDSSNYGGVYGFDGTKWKVIQPARKDINYQLYSMINWYDKLLMAQYPTGNLFEYDGERLRHLKDWPPRMPGVSKAAREAQTTCLYGGDLYTGVWPWAELWRHSAHDDQWHFVKRMFERPAITDKMTHPWSDRVSTYNKNHEKKIVQNSWGQRVTGLTPMGDSLYISVAAKGCFERDKRLEFLHDDAVWDEYRTVYRMRKPGCLAVNIQWTGKPTTVKFKVTNNRIEISQEDRSLGSASITEAQLSRIKEAKMQWGKGMFGPLSGKIQAKASSGNLCE